MCKHRVVRQRVAVPEPHPLLGGLARGAFQLIRRDDADVPFVELPEAGFVERLDRSQPRQVVGWRRRGHRVLVFDTALVGLKGRRHGKDRLAVLNGVHPPGAE